MFYIPNTIYTTNTCNCANMFLRQHQSNVRKWGNLVEILEPFRDMAARASQEVATALVFNMQAAWLQEFLYELTSKVDGTGFIWSGSMV